MSLLSPQLEAFLAIVKSQTVQAAAEKLKITQTGVTQRIRSLESKLGTTLFVRSRRGMRLTQEGEALLRYCQAARELEGEALAKIQGAGKRSEARVSLVGPTSIVTSRVFPAIEPVLERYPELSLSVCVNDLPSRIELLRSGACHLAILPREEVAREMDSKLLQSEHFHLVGPKAWKRRSLEDIVSTERIVDFHPSDQTTFAYLRKHGLLEHVRKERHFANGNELLIRMFANGRGYGVLTADVARTHLEEGSLVVLNPGKTLENEIALAWYPRPELPPYFKALIQAIK